MRPKTMDMFEKIQTILIEEEYISAEEISKKLFLSISSVYRLIRLLREDGIGVLVTKKGYVLAEYAQKDDDVSYLRRLNGRRTSDAISLIAAEPHIKNRWNQLKDKRIINLIIAPLRSDRDALQAGLKQIVSLEDKKGLDNT